jgi:hypothetical protein
MSDIYTQLDEIKNDHSASVKLDTGTLVLLPPIVKRVILYLFRSKNGLSATDILEAEGFTCEDDCLSEGEVQAILSTLETRGWVKARKRRGNVLYSLVLD